MRTIYLDLGMGAAGDMLTAALYELLDDKQRASFIEKMNSLGLDGVKVTAEESIKCGIKGTAIKVLINGETEEKHHHDHHGHDHEHHHDHHEHSAPDNIKHIIEHMPVSENVKNNAIKVYNLIAEAESRAHNRPVDKIHFHEVGSQDAIADVTGVCILMEMLAPDKIVASPVCTGFGKVKCAHGILPVPAPATAFILEGVPMYSGNIEGEMCTPTGAALIRHFVDEFGGIPVIRTNKTGYGMGSRDFEAANCVRAMLGDLEGTGQVVELSCNIDDMTAEDLGYASEVLIKSGALDVYTVPIGMKKSRQGIMLNVMCDPKDKDKFVSLIFKHTTTIGIREKVFNRYTLRRRIDKVDTDLGTVNVKTSEGYGVIKRKAEYDDLCVIAEREGISVREVAERIGNVINES